MTLTVDIGQIIDHKLFTNPTSTFLPFINSILDTPTIDLNISGGGVLTANSLLRKAPVVDKATLDLIITDAIGAIRHVQTGTSRGIYRRNGATWIITSPVITKYTPMGIIANANTNPAFPLAPTLGDARDITTTAGTVGGLAVDPGDLLVFSSSGWIVLSDKYTASLGVETIGDDIQLDLDSLPIAPAPIVATDLIPISRAGVDYVINANEISCIDITSPYFDIFAQTASAPEDMTIVQDILANAGLIVTLNGEAKLAGAGTYVSTITLPQSYDVLQNHNLATISTAINFPGAVIRGNISANGPIGIAVDADHVYTTAYNSGLVTKTNKHSGAFVASHAINTPEGITIHNGRLFVMSWNGSILREINPVTMLAIGADVPLAFRPSHLVGQGNFLYIAVNNAQVIQKVDITTMTVVVTSTVLGQFRGLDVSGSFVYAINNNTNQLQKLRTSDLVLVAQSVAIGVTPYYIDIDGDYAYIADQAGRMQTVYLPTIVLVSNIVTVAGSEGLLVVGEYVYQTGGSGDLLMKIDKNTREIIGSITIGDFPLRVATDGEYLYITNYSSNNYSKVSIALFEECRAIRQGEITVNGEIYTNQTGFGINGTALSITYTLTDTTNCEGTEIGTPLANSIIPNATFDLVSVCGGVSSLNGEQGAVTLTSNNGVSGNGTTDPFSLDIEGLPNTTNPDLTYTFPVLDKNTSIQEEMTFAQLSGVIKSTIIPSFWADPVNTSADLPTTNRIGETRLVMTGNDRGIYQRNGTAWILANPITTEINNEPLTVTATNTLSNIANTPVLTTSKIIVNGVDYVEGVHYTIAGSTVTWTYTNAGGGFDLLTTGYDVYISYKTGAVVSLVAQINWTTAPLTAGSAGTAGQIAYDNDYVYVCVANSTRKRAVLATR